MKKYLITSSEFYTDTPATFRKILQKQCLKHTPDFVLYRDKSNPNYKLQSEDFAHICAEFSNVKSFIHGDATLADSLNVTGVHLTSSQFSEIEYAKSLGLEVIISTHTHDEVKEAEKLGADYVTYSPIFVSPNKGKPKGVEDLKLLLQEVGIKIFALGGIVHQKELDLVEQSGAYGFASIRYFY